MEFPIWRNQLQTGPVFKQAVETAIYQQNIRKYVDEVTTLIAKEVIFRLSSNGHQKYIYRFTKHGINDHPVVPYFNRTHLNTVYQNDIGNIYPTKEILDNLKHKFPDCKIVMDPQSYNITIDWS
jgi:hypothetical protein